MVFGITPPGCLLLMMGSITPAILVSPLISVLIDKLILPIDSVNPLSLLKIFPGGPFIASGASASRLDLRLRDRDPAGQSRNQLICLFMAISCVPHRSKRNQGDETDHHVRAVSAFGAHYIYERRWIPISNCCTA